MRVLGETIAWLLRQLQAASWRLRAGSQPAINLIWAAVRL